MSFNDQINKIRYLGKEIPRSLRDNLVKKEYAMPGQREKMEMILRSPKVPKKIKGLIERDLHEGVYSKTKEVIDRNVEKEMNECMEQKAKSLIKSGEIKDYMQDMKEFNQKREIN